MHHTGNAKGKTGTSCLKDSANIVVQWGKLPPVMLASYTVAPTQALAALSDLAPAYLLGKAVEDSLRACTPPYLWRMRTELVCGSRFWLRPATESAGDKFLSFLLSLSL